MCYKQVVALKGTDHGSSESCKEVAKVKYNLVGVTQSIIIWDNRSPVKSEELSSWWWVEGLNREGALIVFFPSLSKISCEAHPHFTSRKSQPFYFTWKLPLWRFPPPKKTFSFFLKVTNSGENIGIFFLFCFCYIIIYNKRVWQYTGVTPLVSLMCLVKDGF